VTPGAAVMGNFGAGSSPVRTAGDAATGMNVSTLLGVMRIFSLWGVAAYAAGWLRQGLGAKRA
jgi:hypothetical protein